eukprot:4506807-Pleurochrysis_carterae.AAC.1
MALIWRSLLEIAYKSSLGGLRSLKGVSSAHATDRGGHGRDRARPERGRWKFPYRSPRTAAIT